MEFETSGLESQVRGLFQNNLKFGKKGAIPYIYTCPSPKGYRHQWSWDQSLESHVLVLFNPGRSKEEIRTLLATQKENGFIPCVTIWKKKFPLENIFYIDKITQPPVIPMAVENIFEKTHDLDFVRETYPKLKKFMDWLATSRDRNGNGLPEIIHPWEDGDDRNPSFDKQLGIKKSRLNLPENYFYLYRPLAKYSLMKWDEDKIFKSKTFIAETALFGSIYARSLLSMSALSMVLNKGDEGEFFGRYEKTKNAIIELMWNEGDQIFYDLDKNGDQSHIKCISSLMPLILPGLPDNIYKPLIEKHLLNPKEFWTPIPIASVARNEKTFHPGKSFEYWRGPVWINTNWFLAKALINYGYKDKAEELTRKTIDLVSKNGLWEFYNPFSGEGYGQPSFGWSTLALDMPNFF